MADDVPDTSHPKDVPMTLTDPLFAQTRISTPQTDNAPVIVVGMPRSGSSFLSHVLSQIGDWYVFDDLYIQDKAYEIGLSDHQTPSAEQLETLLHFMGWQIRARLRHTTYAIPKMREDEVDAMNDALRACFSGQDYTWLELQKEWMMRLAARSGSAQWGYKMPKAFRNLPALRAAYPEARIVYLLRQPHEVLRSYKFIPETSEDGHPGRYHPLFYALYWRVAAKSYRTEAARGAGDVTLVRFHDLTRDSQETAKGLAAFLGEDLDSEITKPERPNSSFSDQGPKQDLTGLEYWLISRLCGAQIDALGFEQRRKPVRVGDFADVLRVTGRFIMFKIRNRKKI
ncbi:hypothetical protein DI396_15575 [Litorivita pollutaquae]|uniref:Sulfotransferase family protein n=2 Tax=Litorivita pollutaquae TaxID=2200892 RepID=A0A2V4NP45_9RHOB|nr:hypothetical protein DI396_15575 [Litorivita pollutaquae]